MKKFGIFSFLLINFIFLVVGVWNSETHEIAIIKSNNIAPYNQAVDGFKAKMQTNFKEYNFEGNLGRADQVIAEVRHQSPRAIFAVGLMAALRVKESFLDEPPIVCTLILTGADKLNGSNINCISIEVEPEEYLSLVRVLSKEIHSIGIFYSKTTQGVLLKILSTAQKLNFTIASRQLEDSGQLPRGMEILQPKIDAFWLIPDSAIIDIESIKYMLLYTLEKKIPFIVYSPNFVKAGALMSLSVDYQKAGIQSASVVNEIIQGKPFQAKTSPPDDIDLAVNLTTAQRLGLKIPDSLLKKVKYVFR